MADGSRRPIESIRAGDDVLAFDERSGKLSARRVTKVHEHADRPVLGLRVPGAPDMIVVTPVHRFRMGDAWRAIRHASPGTTLSTLGARGDLAQTEVLALDRLQGTLAVYNLSVEESHTYFVGGLLVHNAKEDEQEEPADPKDDDG